MTDQMISTFIGNSYGYSANCNMTGRYVNGMSYGLAYDEEDRLTGVSVGGVSTLVCDGDGK